MTVLTRSSDLRPKHLGSPQVYPFVLSLGIVAQGIIFAVAQARGLDALLINGCVNISQIMMPGRSYEPAHLQVS